MRIGFVAVVSLGLAGCSQASPVGAVLLARTVKATDSSGVGSASCPSTMRLMGGGCSCVGTSDVLFGASPAGNGFICGCYDYGAAGGAVEAVAICLGAGTAATVKEGLEQPDPELETRRDEFRLLRSAQLAR